MHNVAEYPLERRNRNESSISKLKKNDDSSIDSISTNKILEIMYRNCTERFGTAANGKFRFTCAIETENMLVYFSWKRILFTMKIFFHSCDQLFASGSFFRRLLPWTEKDEEEEEKKRRKSFSQVFFFFFAIASINHVRFGKRLHIYIKHFHQQQ